MRKLFPRKAVLGRGVLALTCISRNFQRLSAFAAMGVVGAQERIKMKEIVTFLVGIVLTVAWTLSAAAANLYEDKVAAVVNRDVILESEVKDYNTPFVRKNFALPLGVIAPGKLPTEKEILDELVVIHLLEQEAAKKGIQMSEQGLDSAIDSLKKKNNLTTERFVMFLGSQGINYADYRRMLKRQMILSRVIAQEMGQRINLTEKDAQTYFKENKSRLTDQYQKLVERVTGSTQQEEEAKPEIPTHKEIYTGGRVRLRQIVLKVSDPANRKERARVVETAKKIFDELKGGADFAQLAKKYSQDSGAATGGDLGVMDYKDMQPNLQKLVQTMKEGSVSPPLGTKNGFMIFYLADAKGRQLKKIAISDKERKEMEKEINSVYEKRRIQREQAAKKADEARDQATSNEQKERPSQVKKKIEDDPGVLSEEEKKEYEKVRGKVAELIKNERLETKMREWIDELKKNSIIETKL